VPVTTQSVFLLPSISREFELTSLNDNSHMFQEHLYKEIEKVVRKLIEDDPFNEEWLVLMNKVDDLPDPKEVSNAGMDLSWVEITCVLFANRRDGGVSADPSRQRRFARLVKESPSIACKKGTHTCTWSAPKSCTDRSTGYCNYTFANSPVNVAEKHHPRLHKELWKKEQKDLLYVPSTRADPPSRFPLTLPLAQQLHRPLLPGDLRQPRGARLAHG
jgi:hypothetical protein